MLTEYIEAAMRKAHYELMENGRFWAEIPPCRGVWAEGITLEEVRQELRSVMEDWLLLGFQLGDRIPVVDGINLNPRGRAARQATQGRRKANVRSASIRRSPTHA